MTLDLTLNLTQQQKIIMTQQMQLSMKVLQMSVWDVKEYVESEFLENPVLEIEDKFECSDFNAESKKCDIGIDLYKESNTNYTDDDRYVSPLAFIESPKTLKAFLKEQLGEVPINKYLKSVCEYIVECIDSNGYFDMTLEELQNEINCDENTAKRALILIHNLEPAGIGAKNLKECLILQLKRKGELDSNLIDIINNYLEELADNKYNLIAKNLNITSKKVRELGEIIKGLEPKPSRGFSNGEQVKFIVPDAEIISLNEDVIIIMNDSVIPKLSINSLYNKVIKENDDNFNSDYIREKINSANLLIKSIDQRKNTIYKVLEKIVSIQKYYFIKGILFLKPMTLNDIAKEIGMHESTISRTIKDKYILTSFGTVKLKDLFTTGIKTNGDKEIVTEDMSVLGVKNKIEKLIKEENKVKPISDQKISEILNNEGINISRRTITKYREEMGIKSSNARKRM